MKVGKALSLLVGSLVLLVVAVFIHSRGTLDFRNDEEKIRGVVADFIEACQERDLDDIWDLHSDAWHSKGMSECRFECRRADIAFPEDLDDEALFHHLSGDVGSPEYASDLTLLSLPWLWLPAWLADLHIERVTIAPTGSFLNRKGQAEAILRFSGKYYGVFEPYDVRLVLVRDGRQWRIDFFRARFFELEERPSPLPDIRRDKADDGRNLLAIRIGFKTSKAGPDGLASALAAAPSDTTVRLEVAEDVDLATLTPWLLATRDAGLPEVLLRPCRRSPPRMNYILWVLALHVMTVSDVPLDGANDLLVDLPASDPGTVIVLPVGAGGPPPRIPASVPGEVRMRTIPDEAEPLKERLAAATAKGDPSPPLLAPEAGTSIWKLGAVWRVIGPSPSTPVLLALPGPGAVDTRILRR